MCRIATWNSINVEFSSAENLANRIQMVRNILVTRAGLKDRKWSLKRSGGAHVTITAFAADTRLPMGRVRVFIPTEPAQQPLTLDRYEREFFDLALKFYSEEADLSEDEWRRVNDKQLPRLAKLILERRKIESQVKSQLAELNADDQERVVRFLWGQKLQRHRSHGPNAGDLQRLTEIPACSAGGKSFASLPAWYWLQRSIALAVPKVLSLAEWRNRFVSISSAGWAAGLKDFSRKATT